jgi:hypothetical protein
MISKIIQSFIITFNNITYSIFIGFLTYIYLFIISKPTIDNLVLKINNLEIKQDLLYNSIVELKNIIDMEESECIDHSQQLNEIKNEIQSINKMLDKKDSIFYLSESEDEEENLSLSKENCVLLSQNHIEFSNKLILNEKNVKQNKLTKDTIQLNFFGEDLRLVSNQLSKFLNIEIGICMEYNEVFEMVFIYVHDNEIINITEDQKLRNLFGLNENMDYEYYTNSESNTINFLKKMLEPHLKKIN